MADLIVIEQLHVYLVAQGIAQAPSVAPSLTVPSVWRKTRDGAPLPRAGEKITIELAKSGERGQLGLEAWLDDTYVDVIVRSVDPAAGELVQRRIKDLIEPLGSLGGRKNWMMGSLRVEYSRTWRGAQPLSQRQSVAERDPHRTYDSVASFMFGCRRKILAGLTIP